MTAEKMPIKHVGPSLRNGICPSCNKRTLQKPDNPNYGGLICRNDQCLWKNIYYVGPKSKSNKASAGIMIDLTNHNKRHQVNICYSCPGHEEKGKPILPEDRHARKTADGNGWICGTCALESDKKLLFLFGGLNNE